MKRRSLTINAVTMLITLALGLYACGGIAVVDKEASSSAESSSSASGTGGSGGGSACPNATAQQVADLLGQACEQPDCNASLTRAQFIKLAMQTVPAEKLQGWSLPTEPSVPDVPLNMWYSSYVEQAVWLGLVTKEVPFNPADPTTLCYAEKIIAGIKALP